MLIRYYGHVGQESGYGEAGNEICMAILAAGYNLEISTTGDRLPERFMDLADHVRDEAQLAPHPDVVLVHTLPISCGMFLTSRKIREQIPKARCVAYTTWEGANAAPMAITQALAQFDQVWVPSHQTQMALQVGGIHRVDVVPHPFDTARNGISHSPCGRCTFHHPLDAFRPGEAVVTPLGEATVLEWSQYSGAVYVRVQYADPNIRENFAPCELKHAPLTHPYRFYYLGAWNARKNPAGVVRAFCRAFDHSQNVELVIASAGAPDDVCNLTRLATGVSPDQTPMITFMNARLSDRDIRHLHANNQCFVSATRGESWNLPAFDAMLVGRHIIVPECQGSDDYLVGTSAERYASSLVPAGGEVVIRGAAAEKPGWARAQYMGTQGLTVREDWCEPDLSALAIRMRRAFIQGVRDLSLSYNPADRFGRPAVAQIIQRLLQGETDVPAPQ